MKAVIAPPRVPSPSKNQRDFLFADMAKLADALDLGSSGQPCGFDSHYPYQLVASDISLATSFFISL